MLRPYLRMMSASISICCCPDSVQARLTGCLLLLLTLGLLTGCPVDETTPSLTLWAMGREGEAVQGLMAEFEQRHPGVRVQVQQIPWSAAHEKLLTAFAGDALPDVIQLGNTWVPEFAALEAIAPLEPEDAAVDDVFPGILASSRIDGRLLAMPWYVDTRLLFYRKDVLAQAGFDRPPTTWAEWREAMALVKFLTEPEQQVAFYRLTGDLPARRSAWSHPDLAHAPHTEAFRRQLDQVRPTPKIPEWERIADKISHFAEKAVRGEQGQDEALAALDAEVDRILAKRRWLMDKAESRGRQP